MTSTTVRYKENHLKRIGFVEAMKEHWFQSFNGIESKSEMVLLLTVKPVINKQFNLAWHGDSTGMEYIYVKTADGNYAIEKGNEEAGIL